MVGKAQPPPLHVVPTGNGIPVPANGGGTEGKLYTPNTKGSEQRPESANSHSKQKTAKSENANPGDHAETA